MSIVGDYAALGKRLKELRPDHHLQPVKPYEAPPKPTGSMFNLPPCRRPGTMTCSAHTCWHCDEPEID